MQQQIQKIDKFFKNYPHLNAAVHWTMGVGLGILLTYPFVGAHPVRWGAGLLLLGFVGHIAPMFIAEKRKRR